MASGRFGPTGGTTSAEDWIRAAHSVLDRCDIHMSPSKVSRLVRTYKHRVERNGFSFFEFLATSVALDADTRRRALADPEVQRVISWADPTGETAVRNVMKERGR